MCASGALLNILGPELEEAGEGAPGQAARQRRVLGRLMSAAMAASCVYDAVWESRPPFECT